MIILTLDVDSGLSRFHLIFDIMNLLEELLFMRAYATLDFIVGPTTLFAKVVGNSLSLDTAPSNEFNI